MALKKIYIYDNVALEMNDIEFELFEQRKDVVKRAVNACLANAIIDLNEGVHTPNSEGRHSAIMIRNLNVNNNSFSQ